MADGRRFASPDAGPTHASRRWRAMPRWARWSVRAPLLSEQLRLVVLAMVAGALTGWGASSPLRPRLRPRPSSCCSR